MSFLRPTWKKLVLSALAAGVLGIGGLFLYIASTCFAEASQNCADYSPFGIFVAYVLSWPVLVLQGMFFHGLANYRNYDLVFQRGGWVALWAYYYTLACTLTSIVSRTTLKS